MAIDDLFYDGSKTGGRGRLYEGAGGAEWCPKVIQRTNLWHGPRGSGCSMHTSTSGLGLLVTGEEEALEIESRPFFGPNELQILI